MNTLPNASMENFVALIALLRGHEETLLDPVARKDRARVEAILAEDFFEFGSSGKLWSRNEILDLLATEQFDPPSIESFDCRLIAANVALVTYRTVRTNAPPGEHRITLRSSIWSEMLGVWPMRFHHGSRAASPAADRPASIRDGA